MRVIVYLPNEKYSYTQPFKFFMFSGPSSPAPLNTSGHGYRMYRPSKNSPGQAAEQTQKAAHQNQEIVSNSSSRGLLRVRQARGLGDGWPSPMGEERGMSGGSNTWTRAQLQTMAALIVTTPAMSGN